MDENNFFRPSHNRWFNVYGNGQKWVQYVLSAYHKRFIKDRGMMVSTHSSYLGKLNHKERLALPGAVRENWKVDRNR